MCACAVQQLSFPARSYSSHRRRTRSEQIRRRFETLCFNLHGKSEDGEFDEPPPRVVVLVERYSNGSSKRYVLDVDSSRVNCFHEEDSAELSFLPSLIKDFILPAGFPESVSDDYLQYMLLQVPTNITGWICHTLVTSSLLKAVGIGSFTGTTAAASAAASAAAIRWVSKDGIGALGRLFVGGRFGNLFDDDPKQWRMYADFIGSAGSIFDLTTQVYPTYFLPLASLGNLTKAVARGLKDPSFRVIQNHFAISGNLGEVSAKEEVWEVAAQLIGLALGILILDTPGLVKTFPVLASTWMGMRLFHLWLRFQSLSVLQFNTINLKRARLLVKSHILHSTIPGYVDCNREENIISPTTFMKPRMVLGVPLEDMISGERCATKINKLLRLFEKEKYLLMVNQQKKEFEVLISFKAGATSMSVLQTVWQTYWLHNNWKSSDDIFDQLARSLVEMEVGFADFTHKLKLAGWDLHQINLRVPRRIFIDEASPECL